MSEGREWYELFVNGVQDYAFILFDNDNRVTHWNAGAERILGWTEREIVGQSGAIFFTPEDQRSGEVEREVDTARREGCAEDERWHIRKDGSRFWASGVMTRLLDDHGNVAGFAKVFRDLTARREAAEALRQSEESLRLFQQNVTDHALFEVDVNGCVVTWNAGAQNLFDFTAAEIVGRPVSILSAPDEHAAGVTKSEFGRALADGPVEDERWFVRKGGSRFWGHCVTHPIRDGEGQIRGFANVLRDETSRRIEAERSRSAASHTHDVLLGQVRANVIALDRSKLELRALAARLISAQEDERRRLARDLHDDLGQELAVLQIQLEVALQNAEGISDQFLSALEAAVRRCQALSDRVRDLSHALHPSILADLGLADALQNLVESFRQTQSTVVQLSVDAPLRDLPLAITMAVYRVTQEALRNASKHAAGAAVNVVLSRSHDALYLEISDDGPGFDPAQARARQGLGLISMQERMHQVGGTLKVRSMPGSGTTIVASIPLAGQPDAASQDLGGEI